MSYIRLKSDVIFEKINGELLKLNTGSIGKVFSDDELDKIIQNSEKDKGLTLLHEAEKVVNERCYPVLINGFFCLLKFDEFETIGKMPLAFEIANGQIV